MAAFTRITPEELAILQKMIGHALPVDFVRFCATYKLPELRYIDTDDLDELSGLSVPALIALNENLRDPGLNPEGKNIWQEHFFGLGIRASDDAVYYLDLNQKAPVSTVYVLESGAGAGQLASGDFARWAGGLLEQLEQEDERIRQWHEKQQPFWLRWFRRVFG